MEAGGLGLDAPRHAEPGLRIAFVADPDGNLVELLPATRKLLRPELGPFRPRVVNPGENDFLSRRWRGTAQYLIPLRRENFCEAEA